MPRFALTPSVLLTLFVISPAHAQTVPFHDTGRALFEESASSADADGDGFIDTAELEGFADAAFKSVDTDGDSRMSLAEMRDWQYGLENLAAFRDRTQAFETSIAFVFDQFDRNDDRLVDRDEHIAAVTASSAYADLDGDGRMSLDEYLSGFIFPMAMRNALVPFERLAQQ